MSCMDDIVMLSHDAINVNDLVNQASDPSAGAISTFIGITRDNFENKKVTRLSYEAYEEMAIEEMRKLCIRIRSKWTDIIKIVICHKLGDCPISDISVFIAISSPHRKDSLEGFINICEIIVISCICFILLLFLAVHFAIDDLKATVPIWKKVTLLYLYILLCICNVCVFIYIIMYM